MTSSVIDCYLEDELDNSSDLLENILELFRHSDRLSFGIGLIELPVGHVGEHVVEHVGAKDPHTARDEQRSPVLLEKHRILENTRRHVASLLSTDFVSVMFCRLQQEASVKEVDHMFMSKELRVLIDMLI